MGTSSQPNGGGPQQQSRTSPPSSSSSSSSMSSSSTSTSTSQSTTQTSTATGTVTQPPPQLPLAFKVKEEPHDWTTMTPASTCGGSMPCSLGGSGHMSSPHLPVTTGAPVTMTNVQVKTEPGLNTTSTTPCTQAGGGQPGSTAQQPAAPTLNVKQEPKDTATANGTATVKQEKVTDSMPQKKKRDRFNGMSEEEVLKRTLPDHLHEGLDIVIIGINPGLTAAYVGHHYAGPGNHFWKCLYLSGLIPEPMNAYDDYKLRDLGIGFTNIVERTSRGQADLTRKEIKEGGEILRKKIQQYKPKIAVFNGKGIYEIFCGHKNFYIGRQPEPFPGTDTAVFVMPSSSARCSQLPRAVDKVPFYLALKKLRDYYRGDLKTLDDAEVVFPDLELKVEPRKDKQGVDGQVKTEPGAKPKRDRKRKVKTENTESGGQENSAGSGGGPAAVTPFVNPAVSGGAMGPPGGPWPPGGGPGSLPIPAPPMVPPTSQVPTMDTLFGGTPTLVKTEDCRELSAATCGLFPPHPAAQLDGPPFYGGGFPCSWPGPMPSGSASYQQMAAQYCGGNIPAPTDLSTSGSQSAFPFPGGQAAAQSTYGMSSFNGQPFDPTSASLTPGQPPAIPGMGSPPANFTPGSGFPQYPGMNGGPSFMGGYPQLPGSGS